MGCAKLSPSCAKLCPSCAKLCPRRATLDHLGGTSRERQAAKLNELFAKVDLAVILAGDLNATLERKPLELLKHYWTIAGNGEPRRRFSLYSPTRQIDFVLFRPAKLYHSTKLTVVNESIA